MPFLPSMASNRNQNAQLRRDLDQDADSTNSRVKTADDMKPKHPSAGFAAFPCALPLQSCIREPIAPAA